MKPVLLQIDNARAICMFDFIKSYLKENPDKDLPINIVAFDEEKVSEPIIVRDVYTAGLMGRKLLDSGKCETVICISEGWRLDPETMERTGESVVAIAVMSDNGVRTSLHLIKSKENAEYELLASLDDKSGEQHGKLIQGFEDGAEVQH